MFIHFLFLYILIAPAIASNRRINQKIKASLFSRSERDQTLSKKSGDTVATNTSLEFVAAPHVERITRRIRTTIDDVDIDKLTSEELIFLEDSWKTAYQTIFGGIQVRSLIVTEGRNGTMDRKMLRGRKQTYDFWAMAEFYTCSFCGYDDDDEFRSWWRRTLSEPAATTEVQSLEKLFCQFLHDGVFERFHVAGSCHVEFSEE
eukprot:scaffold5159_cov112-Cylindrotheca_fusiformis.AAC.26